MCMTLLACKAAMFPIGFIDNYPHLKLNANKRQDFQPTHQKLSRK